MYSLPHKAQLSASLAKWQLHSQQSVVLLIGLAECQQMVGWADSLLAQHMHQILKKAKALEMTVIQLDEAEHMDALIRLGQSIDADTQLILLGKMSALFQQMLQHVMSMTRQVCVVHDAILCEHQAQHIQCVERFVRQQVHHMSSASLTRLWSLSAPKEQILSPKGILFAIAEQLDCEPYEIHPDVDLRQYGLDSVAMVQLIALWRANGAHIRYEQFLQHASVNEIMSILQPNIDSDR